MPEYEVDATLIGVAGKSTDDGTLVEVKLAFAADDVNVNQLMSRIKKTVQLNIAWQRDTDNRPGSMFNAKDKEPPAESLIGVTCEVKTGKCHSHKSFSGTYWHCRDVVGKTLVEPCAHLKVSEDDGAEADVVCPGCQGTGYVWRPTSVDADGVPDDADKEPCDRCEGIGHGPLAFINAAPVATTGEAGLQVLAAGTASEVLDQLEQGINPEGEDSFGATDKALADLAAAGIVEMDQPATVLCDACHGSGEIGQGKKARKCQTCDGTGQVGYEADPAPPAPATAQDGAFVGKGTLAEALGPLMEVECTLCQGTGKGMDLQDGLSARCDACKGQGKVLGLAQTANPEVVGSDHGQPFFEAGKCNWSNYANKGYCVEADVTKEPCSHVLAKHPEADLVGF